ncbi:MAG TPA: phosphoribosylglycinamide formyltransferase [Ignavibacteria bacterium]|nr:phosphoribosylglycinamide formyltransferase [Ignavibacteria bacterium]
MKKKFAVFISGYGRGAIEIIKDYKFGLVRPELSLLLSDNKMSYALEIAKKNSISTVVIEKNKYKSKCYFEEEIINELKKKEIDYIFLAGWMNIIGQTILSIYPNKIVNIHPSLLPSFKGLNAIEQALKYGVKITGVTTHIVDNLIDNGKILKQIPISVESNDTFKTLDNKIFKAGTILTLETINEYFI